MLKPYESYKEVNEVWVKDTPRHWEFKRIKHIFYNRTEKNYPIKTECVLSLSAKNGVELQAEKTNKGGNKPKSDFSKYNVAYDQDLLVNCMNVVSGSSGVSNWYGAISPVYYALHTRYSEVNIRYYHYLFRFKPFYRSILRFSKGILMHESDNGNLNTVRMRISIESLNNINIPIPSYAEQDQIVKYLDWQTSKINTLIVAKKNQIKLLKEQRQAVINKAVTKGLEDSVPMKDSGVEWLGEVPEHWENCRLKQVADLINDKTSENTMKYIGMENIKSWTGEYIQTEIVKPEGTSSKYYDNCILFGKLRPYLAKVLIANDDGICSGELLVLRPVSINITLLKYILLSPVVIDIINSSTYGAKMPRANWNFIGNVEIPLQPLEEQQAIVTYLEQKTALIDKAIAVIEKEIDLVSEYKTSLISSVVTGKVDVRDVTVPEFEVVDDAVEDANEDNVIGMEEM